jgi:hypothetical protein
MKDFDNDFVEAAVKGLIKAAWKRALTLPEAPEGAAPVR